MFNKMLVLVAACLLTGGAHAQTGFTEWLRDFEQEALRRGISQATLDAAFADAEGPAQVQAQVIELDRRQPEFIETFDTYLTRRVTPTQIARGQALLVEHAALFDEVERQHGVPRQFLAAFWGLETNYGRTTGSTPIPKALASLAFEGRRSAFFRAELFDALGIIEAGNVAAADMKGSWAGAMGQMQFMPSTYRRYAVDGDRDGRIDLWGSLPDALHSAGNYLHRAGWKSGEPAVLEVRLPPDFDWRYARSGYRRAVTEWQGKGVVQSDGAPLPPLPGVAAILLPQGWRGPAFMVFDNYDVILQWNRSTHYALAVAALAQRLLADAPLPLAAGTALDALSRDQMMLLQQYLGELGFDSGAADGVVGAKTQSAIRRYQSAQQLPVDGYASLDLLAHAEVRHAEAATAGRLVSTRKLPTFSDPGSAP